MRAVFRISLFLIVIGVAVAAFAQSEYRSHMLVRVLPENKARLVELYRYTNLDLVGGDTPDRPNLVAMPEDLQFLQAHGYRYEVIHQNLEQFYVSRMQNPTLLMGGYKTYTEIQAAMDSIHSAHPTIASAKWSIGATLEGRQQWVMLISNLSDTTTAKPEVFYNSLIHAREPEAMECNFYFMNWLTNNYGTDPMATYLVNNRRMYFLPCVNPDGYVYNQTTNPNGGGMWRKNRKPNGDGTYGVDCNRNFDAAWGIDNVGSSPITGDDTYRGTAPFSEFETQHIRDFVNSRHFVTEMDYHTYQDDILIPWGTSYYPAPNGDGLSNDDPTFRMVIDSMNYFIHNTDGVNYLLGTPWQVLYNTNGGSFDWEYENASHLKIYAMTSEVGNTSDGFWPSPSRILPLAQENLQALTFLARIAGSLYAGPYQVTNYGQCESELNGNGNNVIEPGESLNLNFTFKNTGYNALTNIQGQLSTSDPYITITSGTASWSNLTMNQTGTNTTPFQITTLASCPNPYFAPISLHVTAAGLDTIMTLNATIGTSSLSDNVEGGVGGWTTGGGNNEWHISTRRSQSPTHAWFSGQESGNYVDGMGGYLVSPVLILNPGAQISYDQWYSLESGYDYGHFELNTGSGWTQVGTPVTGNSSAWVHTTQTLNIPCASTPVQVRFVMTSDVGSTGEGWYIDNIQTSCPIPPVIAVTPTSVTGHATVGGTDSHLLHICNNGGCALTWSVSYTQTTPLDMTPATMPPVSTFANMAPVPDPVEIPTDKLADDSRHGRDQLDASGGPDAFGYSWKDSNEPNGPVYSWVELVGTGTRLNITGDDQSLSVTLPWAFPYYGSTFTAASVSANGNIHFSADTVDYGNRAIPSTRLPNAMLAAFWDDLSPENVAAPGGVYTYNDVANNRFIVQYDSIPHFSSLSGRYTFEILMYNTGRIVYQYQNLTGAVNSCTVGIENLTGSDGLQVVFNAAYLVNNLAIEFKAVAPWLTFGSPASGSLNPNTCTDVTLNFAAGTLTPGTYNGQLTVQSNDATHNPVTVPVSFIVSALAAPDSLVIHCDAANNTLVMTWHNTNAPHYKVYSSPSSLGPFDTLVGTTTVPTLTIPVPTDLRLFYQVTALDQ